MTLTRAELPVMRRIGLVAQRRSEDLARLARTVLTESGAYPATAPADPSDDTQPMPPIEDSWAAATLLGDLGATVVSPFGPHTPRIALVTVERCRTWADSLDPALSVQDRNRVVAMPDGRRDGEACALAVLRVCLSAWRPGDVAPDRWQLWPSAGGGVRLVTGPGGPVHVDVDHDDEVVVVAVATSPVGVRFARAGSEGPAGAAGGVIVGASATELARLAGQIPEVRPALLRRIVGLKHAAARCLGTESVMDLGLLETWAPLPAVSVAAAAVERPETVPTGRHPVRFWQAPLVAGGCTRVVALAGASGAARETASTTAGDAAPGADDAAGLLARLGASLEDPFEPGRALLATASVSACDGAGADLVALLDDDDLAEVDRHGTVARRRQVAYGRALVRLSLSARWFPEVAPREWRLGAGTAAGPGGRAPQVTVNVDMACSDTVVAVAAARTGGVWIGLEPEGDGAGDGEPADLTDELLGPPPDEPDEPADEPPPGPPAGGWHHRGGGRYGVTQRRGRWGRVAHWVTVTCERPLAAALPR